MRTILGSRAAARAPSDEAVRHATGKTWREWFADLDERGAHLMPHREIAAMLFDQKLIDSGWWSQMVTVEYEKSRGLRVPGQTANTGFQVGVTKTLPISQAQAWNLLTRPEGLRRWLGVPRLKLAKGEPYAAPDGTTGAVRTLKPGERLRLTWRPKGRAAPTVLQITVQPRKSVRGTCICFHHERLESPREREQMRRHWQEVMERLSSMRAGAAP